MPGTPAKPDVKLITPPARWPGLGLGEMWRARRVLWVLSQRQFKARYSNMVLGVLWVLLEPLMLTIIITVFMGLVMGRGERLGLPFPVFLFAAFVVWRPFTKVVNAGGASIKANAVFVERIYLPRAFLPLSDALVSVVDLAFMALAFSLLIMLFGITPGMGLLVWPIALVVMYAFGLGAAFFSAAVGMSFPDIDFIRPLLVRAWFWMSPILYPSTMVPEEWRNLYYLNPMVLVIDATRWAFTQTPSPPLQEWIIGASSAGVVLVFGYVYFRRRDPLFSDLL
jgi:lipopolysaccharide transport system permease protein